MPNPIENYEVNDTQRVLVPADQSDRIKVSATGGTVYYGSSTVTAASNDGSILTGANITLASSKYFISATKTQLTVERLQDVAQRGGLAVTTTPRIPTVVATSLTYGTDKTPVITETYIAEIVTHSNCTLTGVEILIGSVGGTDSYVGALYAADGKVVANTDLAGTTVGTAATFQQIAFTSAYKATGPLQYFIGVQVNGTTARLRTIPVGPRLAAGKKTSETFGTLTTITPITTFTADLGPVANVY